LIALIKIPPNTILLQLSIKCVFYVNIIRTLIAVHSEIGDQ
jgi:hypothetical protein